MSQSIRLGFFVLLGLAILGAAVFLIGSKESLFQSNFLVRAQFQNVGGLNEGADVRVGGIRMGTVRHIELPNDPSGKVTVLMDVAKSTQEVLREDSMASIQSAGLLGDKFVELSFGTEDKAHLKSGQTINSVPPLEISEIAGRANHLLDTAQEAVSNISAITAKINQGKGTAGALINDRTMYDQATASVSAMHDDMEALKSNFLLKGFFNKRGYVDSDELKKHQISVLPPGPSKTFDYPAKAVFDKASSAKLKDQKMFDAAGEYLQNAKFGLAVVASSAGVKGDSERDRTLNEARTMVVRNYLVQNFKLDDTRIRTLNTGKNDQLGENGKVQIFVYSGKPASRKEQPPAAR
jgi:phospholipid/cholesterol/gamma-HCH transport system substrate-binding protein